MNQIILDSKIISHKKTIAGLFHNEIVNEFSDVKDILSRLKKQYSEISLVIADFKCQSCGKDTQLQYHHLIPRIAKFYVDKVRYISSRFYWANVIILCRECHSKYHGFPTNELYISEDRIGKLKEKYK